MQAQVLTPQGRAYGYGNTDVSHSQSYQRAYLDRTISGRSWRSSPRALDFGCGNGSNTAWLVEKGFHSAGVDISPSGVELARLNVPAAHFSNDTSLSNLNRLGPFDLVLCMEVIAHCYYPATELKKFYQCLNPGGTLLLSTPYHSYLKNLAMAVTGALQHHLDTSWDGAYVHFFTVEAMTDLLRRAGFEEIRVARAGRIPPLAKSMIFTCTKPL